MWLLYFVFRAILVKRKFILFSQLHFLFSVNPVCVCVCLWVKEKSMFQHGWFVVADTHIFMLNKEEEKTSFSFFFVYFLFLSTNNQGFCQAPHVFLFCFYHVKYTICICGVEECMWISSGLVLDKRRRLCDVCLCNLKLRKSVFLCCFLFRFI